MTLLLQFNTFNNNSHDVEIDAFDNDSHDVADDVTAADDFLKRHCFLGFEWPLSWFCNPALF